MAEATVLNYQNTGIPNIEVVTLELTDGETFTSRKFSELSGAVVSGNEDVDAHINAVITDGTSGAPASVAINYAGQTDKDVTLVLFGKLGN